MAREVTQRTLTIDELKRINNNQDYSLDFIRRLEHVLLKLPLPGQARPGDYTPEGEKGEFSEALIEAIKNYQGETELVEDGVLGKNTLSSLRKKYPEYLSEPLRIISGNHKDGRTIIPKDTSKKDRYRFYKELALNRFGIWRSGINEANIVGVRSMLGGIQVPNTPDEFNDTIALLWFDENKKEFVEEFVGSVDPGKIANANWMCKDGLAHIKDGTYFYFIGRHHSRYPTANNRIQKANSENEEGYFVDVDSYMREGSMDYNYEALNSHRPVRVYRDIEVAYDYLNVPELDKREFIASGVDIHFAAEGGKVGDWSQGCQVISGGPNYVKFIGILKELENKYRIPYTVVDASKVEESKPA